jgi:hypothetical protein
VAEAASFGLRDNVAEAASFDCIGLVEELKSESVRSPSPLHAGDLPGSSYFQLQATC